MQKKSRPDIGRPVIFNSEQLKVSFCHPEDHVALESLLGPPYPHIASGRSGWHTDLDFAAGNHSAVGEHAASRDSHCWRKSILLRLPPPA